MNSRGEKGGGLICWRGVMVSVVIKSIEGDAAGRARALGAVAGT